MRNPDDADYSKEMAIAATTPMVSMTKTISRRKRFSTMTTDMFFHFDDLLTSAGSPDAAAKLLLEKLRQAPADCHKQVVFSAGREYHFFANDAQEFHCHISNHEQCTVDRCAILLQDLRNVTLHGNAARLLMHGCLVPLAVVNCRQITAEDLSIDYPFPSVHQLQVIKADETRDEMLCEICGQAECFIEENRLVFRADNREFRPYWCMPFEANRHLVYRCADQPLYEPKQPKLKLEDARHVRFIHPNRLFQPGQRLVLRDAHRPAPACFAYLCKSLIFNKINIYSSDGMGLLAQRCEDITLTQCACTPSPAQPWRYFSCLADATHFVGCKGTIRVEDSLFEQMGDDAINVHGIYLSNIVREDAYTLLASYCHRESWGFRWGEPGDRLRFLAAQTMEELPGEWTIKAISPADTPAENGAKLWRITTVEPLPELDAGSPWGLENVTWAPDVLFRRNIVRDNRARGALFTTRGEVRCEENRFDHVHGCAILVCGDCSEWFESGSCEKLIITRNEFIDNLTAEYEFCEAVISVAPHITSDNEPKTPIHGTIEVTGNHFTAFDAPLLYVHSAQKVVFHDNKVVPSAAYTPWHPNRESVILREVVIKDILL